MELPSDTYNRFLKRAQRKHWIVFVNDVLFWLMQGLIIFYVLFIVNKGELRFYIFIALVCGFATYQSLMKRIYLKWLEMVISWIVSIWRFLVKLFLHLIYRPLLSLFSLLISLIIALGRGLFALILFIGRASWWIIKLVLAPIRMVLLILWKLLPKIIKKNVEKLYNKNAGFFKKIKKYVSTIFNRWKKHTK